MAFRVEQGGISPAVLVTGASSGIGRQTALLLADHGFEVFAGVRDPSDGEALKALSSGSLSPLTLDITDRAGISKAKDDILEALGSSGRPLHLVNNAGQSFPGPLEYLPLDDLRGQLEVNAVAALDITQTFLPHIRANGGRIAFVSSMFGRFPVPFVGAYCASKSALGALAGALRMELRPWGTPVCLIEPGAVKSEIWQKFDARLSERLYGMDPAHSRLYESPASRAREAAARSARRGMNPEKVARIVEKALSVPKPKDRYIVGLDARAGILAAELLPSGLFEKLLARRF